MPVGTKATVKALHPGEVKALGAQVILANTYHLHFRPGEDVIEELGGLHQFAGWDGPILTDSGGFQVFSLSDTVLELDDDGVTFRSVYDGTAERFTPEGVAEIERGSAPTSPCASTSAHRRDRRCRCSSRPSSALACGRSGRSAPPVRRASCASASPRAAPTPSCGAARSRRSSRSASTATHSEAWRWAKAARRCSETVGWAAPLLPSGKPRYFMGLGDTEGILGVIAAGIDMFDCVLPTRTARTGSALTATGRINLHNARFSRDPRPLEADCPCPACERFSRAYLRHLVNQDEILGLRLLSLHNLSFVHRLTAGARTAIRRGAFAAYRAEALARLAAGPQEDPCQAR